jgi:6-phosphogluconolactonase
MNIVPPVGSLCVGLLALLLIGVTALGAEPNRASTGSRFFVYFGTYTGAKSRGIYVAQLTASSGELTRPELAAETAHPTFLAVHPNQRFLYAANEIGEFANRKNNGAVSAFAIDPPTGKLTLLNQESSGGGGPCHLVVDQSGKHVLVANYGGGSVEVLPIDEAGKLGQPTAFIQHQGSGVNRQRQEGPHAHGICLDAANRLAFVADLGLDRVLAYQLDAARGTLTANEPPFVSVKPGAGPRHFAFHPSGRFAYVINELDSTITAFAYDARRGALTELQTLATLPEQFHGDNTTAEVEVHPSGQFLYGSNRGHDSLAVFAIDPDKGTLRPVEHVRTLGKSPRSFGIDPTGQWLLAANQGTDNVAVFRIDRRSGRLTATGQTLEVGAPVCVKFVAVK